jgi:hypothetical protein
LFGYRRFEGGEAIKASLVGSLGLACLLITTAVAFAADPDTPTQTTEEISEATAYVVSISESSQSAN